MSILVARRLRKGFPGPPPVEVLSAVDLEVAPRECIAIQGRSGAGKSTLLNILGLLDSSDSGAYHLCGHDVGIASRREKDRLRSQQIGFVFQSHHVLGHRTAAQNLHVKLDIVGTAFKERTAMVQRALEDVGMLHREDTPGRVLSGGEKQRLAFARAMISKPLLILADEPTGNLDDDNSADVLGLLAREAERGAAVVVITHDTRIGAWADRCLRLEQGILSSVTT